MTETADGEGKKTLEQLLDEIEARQEGVDVPSRQEPAKGSGEVSSSPELASAAMLQLVGKLPALMSVLGGTPKNSSRGTPDPQALLCALRPYLNDRRREEIDSMLQLWKIRSLLQSLRTEPPK